MEALGNNQTFWKIHWVEKAFDIIDIGLGYYVVRFFSENDYQKVLTGGPYKMYNHYLTVQPWEPNFQPENAKPPKTTIWVHFQSAPMEQFQETILHYLASMLGRLIKIDRTTLLASRGRFARVCIEIDLSKSLPPMIKLKCQNNADPIIIKCAYEGLHKICFCCGEFGHTKDECRLLAERKAAEEARIRAEEAAKAGIEASAPAFTPDSQKETVIFGDWMIPKNPAKKPRMEIVSRFSQRRNYPLKWNPLQIRK